MTNGNHAWQISYQRSVEYEIVKSFDLFDPENESLLSLGKRDHTRRFVVVDDKVEKYYSTEIRDYFRYHEVEAKIVPFPGGEENKSIHGYLTILNELDSFPIHRRDEPIIAIGGGVLTDVVGFVAGSYRRGVPHIKVPTTLIGYIDAAVGIKTGINFNGSKNRLGSFEPPQKVLLDKTFLKTLPKRHILNGVCEILKLAVIKDLFLFELLESYGADCIAVKFQNEPGTAILDRSIEKMLEELQPNLFEENLARRMDFGHTFCYGLETCQNSHLLHGEAVLIDIVLSIFLARARGFLSVKELIRTQGLIAKLGVLGNHLHLDSKLVDPYTLWESITERTYHRNGFQRIPLPNGIGDCVFINDLKLEEIQLACHEMQEDWMGCRSQASYSIHD